MVGQDVVSALVLGSAGLVPPQVELLGAPHLLAGGILGQKEEKQERMSPVQISPGLPDQLQVGVRSDQGLVEPAQQKL